LIALHTPVVAIRGPLRVMDGKRREGIGRLGKGRGGTGGRGKRKGLFTVLTQSQSIENDVI